MATINITGKGREALEKAEYETEDDRHRMVLEALGTTEVSEPIAVEDLLDDIVSEVGDEIDADGLNSIVEQLVADGLAETSEAASEPTLAEQVSHMLNKAIKAGRVEGNVYTLSQADIRALIKEGCDTVHLTLEGLGRVDATFNHGAGTITVEAADDEQPVPEQGQIVTLDSLAERVASLEEFIAGMRNQRLSKAGGPANPRAYSKEEDALLANLVDQSKSNKEAFQTFAKQTGRSVHGASYRWSRVLKPILDAGQDPRTATADSEPNGDDGNGDGEEAA